MGVHELAGLLGAVAATGLIGAVVIGALGWLVRRGGLAARIFRNDPPWIPVMFACVGAVSLAAAGLLNLIDCGAIRC
jgi:predicted membrane metal-binding protein